MNIVSLTLNDIDEILLLQKQSDFSDGWNKNQFISSFNSGRFVCFGIKEEELIAFVGVSIGFDTADLEDILVLPSERGKGVASLLMEKVQEYLMQKNIVKLFLEVRKSNQTAISFYKKFQFEKISERVKYYSDNEDAVIMAKELTV